MESERHVGEARAGVEVGHALTEQLENLDQLGTDLRMSPELGDSVAQSSRTASVVSDDDKHRKEPLLAWAEGIEVWRLGPLRSFG